MNWLNLVSLLTHIIGVTAFIYLGYNQYTTEGMNWKVWLWFIVATMWAVDLLRIVYKLGQSVQKPKS